MKKYLLLLIISTLITSTYSVACCIWHAKIDVMEDAHHPKGEAVQRKILSEQYEIVSDKKAYEVSETVPVVTSLRSNVRIAPIPPNGKAGIIWGVEIIRTDDSGKAATNVTPKAAFLKPHHRTYGTKKIGVEGQAFSNKNEGQTEPTLQNDSITSMTFRKNVYDFVSQLFQDHTDDQNTKE